jgi:hypothetical protein
MKISLYSSNQNKFFGSKSGIRCLYDLWIWDHISESLKTIFWGSKYIESLMWIRDGKNSDLGWKKVGYGIQDKHPDWQH